jgi:uncharacterized membrane protein YjjB (DUF3815 family)
MARLGLANGVLLASALGVVLGIELTLSGPLVTGQDVPADHLNVGSDMLLAGIVTCGFAVFYNTPWPQLARAVLGGMAGHGLRFLAVEAGWRLEAATLLGGLAVGVVSAWMARSNKSPVAVIAFAGAVTLMPGLQMYRFLRGALELARLKNETDLSTIAETLGNGFHACLVVSALALGLVVGARVVLGLTSERDAPTTSSLGSQPVEAYTLESGQTRLPSEPASCLPEMVSQDAVND